MKDDAERIYRQKRASKKPHIEKWRKYWREAGPVRFAEEYLFTIPNVPPFPNWRELQEEFDCKPCGKKHMRFHDSGVPVHLVLSEGQKEVLTDAWVNGIMLLIISAGRGAGKTFMMAVWDCWRLCCFDYYEVTCMGGSEKQTKLLQKYIDHWTKYHKEVGYIIHKSTKAIGNRACLSRMSAEVNFIPCSPTAAMGPHVNEVQIDEECAAESRGSEGMEAIEAIDWQITGRTNTYIWRTSTSHFIFGKFYEILTEPKKHGYKAYFWGIAKHKSGKPARLMYKDRNPDNWEPAVWWVTQADIVKLRKKSDEEWLCWALGYPSLSSGQVLKEDDMNIIKCDVCQREGRDCIPYKWGYCKLIERFNLGDASNPIMFIIDRKAGFDYGDPAPCALIIAGIRPVKGKNVVFILYAEEQKGLPSMELYGWVIGKMKLYKAQDFYPDPSIGGKHVNEKVDEAGFGVVILDSQAKEERISNIKCIVERHNMIIPVAFWQLLGSMRMVHRKKGGKINKHNDHSFDAICYVCSDWGDLEGNAQDVFDVVMEFMGLKERTDYNKEEEEGEDFFFGEKSKGIKFWGN